MYDIKLLLVEDDTIIRGIYERVLRKTVSNIILAKNGEEGYELFKKEKPDLILSDIKMPVMNGLDMIHKIRGESKTVRIIIMSAYGESRYFINAIESGVKGFLTKPIKNEHLEKIVSEQANDILLEKNLKKEEKKRISAEMGRKKSDKILTSLSTITATFFQKGLNKSTILSGLKLVGEATESSRVVLYKLEKENDIPVANLQYIWRENKASSVFVNSDNKKIPINSPMLTKWLKLLKSNINIGGNVSDFESSERKMFESSSSKSLMVIPVFVNEDLWGFINLDDTVKERSWSKNEINALYSFSYNLGAALYRKNSEQELIHMNINLEKRVKERTKELEIEIAERTNAQILLRESEEKYRLIFENASEGILLVQNREIILTNPAMVELMEKLPKNLIGFQPEDFITSSNKSEVKDFFSSNENINSENSFEVMISTKSEKHKWLELKVNGIEWDTEPGYLIFAADVTLRKIAQNKLKKLNKSLENRVAKEIRQVKKQQELLIQKTKLESLGELSAGLAHEINQPLGGLSMGLENIIFKMSQNQLDNNYINSKINVLFKDIDRINNIIEHVRTFSRDQQNASVEIVHVDHVVANAISLINKQYQNHQVELIIKIPKGTFTTKGNPFRLEQVILNILSNAKSAVDSKYENSNDETYKKKIQISLEKNEEFIFLKVCDNGVGMTKRVINKIFEPFFTTKDQQSGTGLGLSISYGIIKEMKGVIKAESEKNIKTKLTIQLPLNKA
jgi:PAS domain S-box-containing protein